ncbi:hypothetical protein [Lutibacter sp.]|uniref:hypothetical protein n=1 Tax=Lutibacter sp. TaxID=1925666 RepID=UPI002736C45D|nr:hypothetical protein [Lutibacter sp.]MDP3313105.1 hypothetical protein [Lutibacter sp.]
MKKIKDLFRLAYSKFDLKKFLLLFGLFIAPLIFYIFLSLGIYKHQNLPILTEEVTDFKPLSSTNASFATKLNIVCFLGSNISEAKASLFNLNQTIYKRYYQKPYFQAVAIIPKESEKDYSEVIVELSAFTDIKNWQFVYASKTEIQQLFASFKTPFDLNQNLYSENAFIVDMDLRLRGRKDDEDTSDGKLYGYTMKEVATLKNKMKDDIAIIYYQLKKSEEKKARRKREI